MSLSRSVPNVTTAALAWAARIGRAAAAVALMSLFPCHPHTDVESCLAKT